MSSYIVYDKIVLKDCPYSFKRYVTFSIINLLYYGTYVIYSFIQITNKKEHNYYLYEFYQL